MLKTVCKLVCGILMSVLLTNSGVAQTNSWSTQNFSGCSDELASFDAFIPGMRGHGSCTRGGFVNNTTVHVVTNTNASGSGSLEEALESFTCPKVILFAVAGLIDFSGSPAGSIQTRTNCDNWSLVGASAPGAGIAICCSESILFNADGDDWTVDHMIMAAGDINTQGGQFGNRDTMSYGFSGLTNGISLNNTLIWGSDEIAQCYSNLGDESTNILWWQNIIGIPVGGAGVHIIQDTCPNSNTIRTFYIHSKGRTPLVRADGYYASNNFSANPGYQSASLIPCNGSYGQPDPLRQNYINNLTTYGPNTGGSPAHSPIRLDSSGGGCTTVELHESGNRLMENTGFITDCSNNACTANFSATELKGSAISDVVPTGHVPEVVVDTAAGHLEFANQITTYAGAFPTNRLAYIQTKVDEGINNVDQTGDKGGAPGGALGDFDTDDEGGKLVITPASSSWDPTDSADNPCGIDMPTGSAANDIKTSGLTGLHEWVIGCFYDYVMPAGYREDKLQNYPAPGGGGKGLPAARPNPPSLLDVS